MTTEAGRALLDWAAKLAPFLSDEHVLSPSSVAHIEDAILAIERQAAERLRDDLRGRVETNLRVYQHRVDKETATDFDRGKRAAFRVVLTMLDDRPHEATFSCARPARDSEDGT